MSDVPEHVDEQSTTVESIKKKKRSRAKSIENKAPSSSDGEEPKPQKRPPSEKTLDAMKRCQAMSHKKHVENKYIPYYKQHGWAAFAQKYPKEAIKEYRKIHVGDMEYNPIVD